MAELLQHRLDGLKRAFLWTAGCGRAHIQLLEHANGLNMSARFIRGEMGMDGGCEWDDRIVWSNSFFATACVLKHSDWFDTKVMTLAVHFPDTDKAGCDHGKKKEIQRLLGWKKNNKRDRLDYINHVHGTKILTHLSLIKTNTHWFPKPWAFFYLILGRVRQFV